MKKGLGKRLVSLILCAAMLVTMAPDLVYAAQGDRQNVTVQKESGENADAEETAATETAAAQQSEDRTEKSLEYALNGGSFVEGYTAPDTYPQTDLPDWQDVTNPGYAFGGWYDNKELAGDAIASVSDCGLQGGCRSLREVDRFLLLCGYPGECVRRWWRTYLWWNG